MFKLLKAWKLKTNKKIHLLFYSVSYPDLIFLWFQMQASLEEDLVYLQTPVKLHLLIHLPVAAQKKNQWVLNRKACSLVDILSS